MEQNNREKFIREFSILHRAAVGVSLVRTGEPHRAIEAIREYAAVLKYDVRVWTVRDGWRSFDPSTGDLVGADKTYDIVAALKRVRDISGDSKNPWNQTFAIMVWPHIGFTHPAISSSVKDCIRQYCRELPLTETRVVMIVPETVSPPSELSHDLAVVSFDPPARGELKAILTETLSTQVGADYQRKITKDQFNQILALGGGMTEGEFETSLSKALILHQKGTSMDFDFDAVAKTVSEFKSEVVRRSDVLELTQPEDISNVGGLDNLKEWILRRKVALSPEAKENGVDSPKGILCIGPSGSGKSLIAKAVASILCLPLIRFDIERVLGSLVGESEGRMRQALKQINAVSPAVVWVDEIDKAGMQGSRPGGDSGVSTRLLGILLKEMQETKSTIFWVFTANRHEHIDSALLRKGRIDELFAVLAPNARERKEILEIHLRKRNCKIPADLELAVDAAKGYLGAEIEEAVKDAKLTAFIEKREPTAQDIIHSLSLMKPWQETFAEDAQSMLAWASRNARMASRDESEKVPEQKGRRIALRAAQVESLQ